MSPEIVDLLSRIENWRRCYKTNQRIAAVPWYTPPKLGDVYADVAIGSEPININDAILLERSWRNISDEPKKFFIKSEYIVKMHSSVIRRKLKRFGIKIHNHADYSAFSYAALFCFVESIKRNG